MKTFKFADTSVFLHDQDLPDLLDYKDEIGITILQFEIKSNLIRITNI